MFKLARKATSAVVAGAIALGTLALYPTGEKGKVNAATLYDSVSAVNYATILGRATDFGIVAETLNHNHHMESTFAVNHLKHNGADVTDVDYIDGLTAQFIIAHVDQNYFSLGSKQTAGFYNIEVSDEVYNAINTSAQHSDTFTGYPFVDRNGNTNVKGSAGRISIDYDFTAHEDQNIFIYSNTTNATEQNIKKIIENTQEKSDSIASKAGNAAYNINPDDYRKNPGETTYYLNLSNTAFAGKVIYINVSKTSEIYKYLNDDKLTIQKSDSTVVAFNFDDTFKDSEVVVGSYWVTNDGTRKYNSTSGWSGGDLNVHNDTNSEVDQHICQKIIWNFNIGKGSVKLVDSAGVFLVPSKDVSTLIAGPSAGWIVTAGYLENKAEFHYIYSGGSQEMTSDGSGQLHFAARKAITDKFDGKNTKENTSVFVPEKTFTFNWYETDSTFSTEGKKPVTTENQATNTVKFPVLSFRTAIPEQYTETVDVTSTVESYPANPMYQGSEFWSMLNTSPDDLKFTITYNDPVGGNNLNITFTDNQGNSWIITKTTETTPDGSESKITFSGSELLAFINASENASAFNATNMLSVSVNGYTSSVKASYPQTQQKTVTKIRYVEDPAHLNDDNYIPNNGSKTFYYVITEEDAGTKKTVDGHDVGVSNGRITIALTATATNGVIRYKTTTRTYLDDGSIYKENTNDVPVSGPEFTLGAFYNKILTPGYLKVTKSIAGGADPKELQITVKDGDKVLETYILDDNLNKNNETGLYESEVLIVDDSTKTYTVEETLYDVTGYTVKSSYKINAGQSVDATSAEVTPVSTDPDNPTTVNFTNTYTKILGSLKVSKSVDTTNAPGITVPTAFSFYVKNDKGDYLKSDGSFTDDETIATYTIGNNGTIAYTDVPAGTYTVAEVGGSVKGYTLNTTYENNKASIENNGDEQTITIKNTYEKEEVKGKLHVTKTVDTTNAAGITVPTSFSFYVKSADDKYLLKDGTFGTQAEATYTVAAGETFDYADVPEGTYTVTEVGGTVVGYKLTTTFTNNDAKIESSTDNKTITIKNTYVKEEVKGKLHVTKTVDTTNAAGITVPTSFSFYVKSADNKYLLKDGTFGTQAEATYTVAAGETFDYADVPEGTYTVTEVGGTVVGYKLTTTFTNNDAKIESSTDNKTITIKNTYVKEEVKGKLHVTKTVDTTNAAGITVPTSFSFYVKSADDKYLLKNGTFGTQAEATYTVAAGETFDYADVPEGTYTVTEEDGTVDGYKLTTTFTNNGAKIKSSTDNKTITIKNTYEKKEGYKGSLEIKKTITLPDGVDLSKIGDITFTISPAINGTSSITLKPSDPGEGWTKTGNTFTYTFADLTQGTKYTVTETADGSNESYEVTVTPTSKECEVTIPTDNTQNTSKTAEFTNKYAEKSNYTGTLFIKKTISLPDGVDLSKIDDITFTISPAINGTSSITLKPSNPGTGWTKTGDTFTYSFADLEQGTKYTITESATGSNATYDVTVTPASKKAEVKIPESDLENTTISADFANKYSEKVTYKGSLVIQKSIELPDGADLSKIGDITFTISPAINGTSSITLKPSDPGEGWTKTGNTFTYTFADLTQGTKYTVTETADGSNESYEVTVTPTSKKCEVTIPTDNTQNTSKTAEFTNKYAEKSNYTGTLFIKKTISLPDGVDLSKIDDITFTISPAINGTSSITLKPSNPGTGWTKTGDTFTYSFADLEQGTKYTITESATGSNATYDVTVTPASKKAEVKIPESDLENTTISADFANKYSEKVTYKGSLIIQKTIVLPDGVDLSKIGDITFTISPAINGTSSITLKPSNPGTGWTKTGNTFTYTFANLTQGTKYTVTETADGSNESYEVVVTPTDKSCEVTIPASTSANTSATAEFTNDYSGSSTSSFKGSLLIQKSITLPDGVDLSKIGDITFTISPAINGTSSITLKPSNPGTGWTKTGNTFTYTFADLTQGTKYTVTETADGSNAAYEVTVTPTSKKCEVTIPTDNTQNTSKTAEFTNKYAEKVNYTGTLFIQKTISLPDGVDLSKIDDITFTISPAINGTSSITLKPSNPGTGWTKTGETFTYSFADLEQGTKYTVTETADGSNSTYEVVVTPSDKKCEVTVPESTTQNTTVNAEFSNKYSEKITYKGSLIIQKSIVLPDGVELSKIGDITFTISPAINGTSSITLKPSNPGEGWTKTGNTFTYTFADLVQGSKYTVTESADGSNSSYEATVTPSEKKCEVTIPTSTSANTSVSASFTNKYSEKVTYKGTLFIQKTITLPDGVDLSEIGDITFTISPAINGTSSITLKPSNPGTGWTKTGNTFTYSFDNLEQGKKYTVTESADGSNDSYEVTVTPTGKSREVTVPVSNANSTVTAEFANKYSEKSTGSDLEVTFEKKDEQNKLIANAELTLKSLDGYDMSNVYVMQNGKKITHKLSDDKTAITFATVDTAPSVVCGLKAGDYSLTETVTPKKYLTADAITFTLYADGTNNITVSGSPIVMIDRADPKYKPDDEDVISANRKPVPATGEEISFTSIIGVALICTCAVCLAGLGIYRIKRKRS